MDPLTEALRINSPSGALDRAALALACIEYPQLDPQPYVALLDDLARRVADRMDGATGPAFVAAANSVLFDDFGLTGNETDYYDPRNSFLNDVLDRRTGIPITLSLVYMEIARRLHRTVFGIGLPGHFVLRYEDDQYRAYIDAFHRGRTLTRRQCADMVRSITSVDIAADDRAFAPASIASIVVRMIHNLRTVYLRRERWDKLVPVLDLLLAITPDSAEEYRQRGIALVRTGRFQRGRSDLARYLELAADAADRDEVIRQLQAIHDILGRLN